MVFYSANPRNNYMTGSSFLEVEKKSGSSYAFPYCSCCLLQNSAGLLWRQTPIGKLNLSGNVTGDFLISLSLIPPSTGIFPHQQLQVLIVSAIMDIGSTSCRRKSLRSMASHRNSKFPLDVGRIINFLYFSSRSLKIVARYKMKRTVKSYKCQDDNCYN